MPWHHGQAGATLASRPHSRQLGRRRRMLSPFSLRVAHAILCVFVLVQAVRHICGRSALSGHACMHRTAPAARATAGMYVCM